MTIPVSLQELPDKAREFGQFAFVITSAGAPTSPRVTHVQVTFVVDGSAAMIETELGKSACRELAKNPHVTVLWPAKDNDDNGDAAAAAAAALSLIVDGHVEMEQQNPTEKGGGTVVRIVPTSAILHQKRTTSL
jgi:hypothetical protein